MTDDERNALANMKNAEAIDLLVEVINSCVVPSFEDTVKLARVLTLAEEAKQIASGVDRGSLKGKTP